MHLWGSTSATGSSHLSLSDLEKLRPHRKVTDWRPISGLNDESRNEKSHDDARKQAVDDRKWSSEKPLNCVLGVPSDHAHFVILPGVNAVRNCCMLSKRANSPVACLKPGVVIWCITEVQRMHSFFDRGTVSIKLPKPLQSPLRYPETHRNSVL